MMYVLCVERLTLTPTPLSTLFLNTSHLSTHLISPHTPASSYLFRSAHFQMFPYSPNLPFQPWGHFKPSVWNLTCHHFNTSSGFWTDKSVIKPAVDQMKENKKQVELAKVWGLGLFLLTRAIATNSVRQS